MILLNTTDISSNTTVTISLIAAISAIVAPLLTALISNIVNYKTHKLDISMEQERLLYPKKEAAYASLVSAMQAYKTEQTDFNRNFLNYNLEKCLLFCDTVHSESLWTLLYETNPIKSVSLCDTVLTSLTSDLQDTRVKIRKSQRKSKRNK